MPRPSSAKHAVVHDDALDTDLGERYYKNSKALEDRGIDAIVSGIRDAIGGHFQQGRRPARRDAHAYDNGCVRAIFRVDPDLPADFEQGIFVRGREYPAWIRFSNGNSEARPRWLFDARGMAIKLMGVAGDKLLDDEKHTQDFVLISHSVFFVDDLERYKATLEAFLRGGYWDQYVSSFLKLRPRERWLALRANANFTANPLSQRYWSMTPYRLGSEPGRKFAVKYSAKPRFRRSRNFLSRHISRFGRSFSLKNEMSKTLAGNEVWFDFYVQRYVDARTPIEDTTVEWSEKIAPLKHIATIIVPIQEIMSPEQARFCENLSFSPWHGLPEHRPLGLVNRVRKVAYRAISDLRHQLNRVQPAEPTGNETFDTR